MSAVQAIISEWESPSEFGRDIGVGRYNHAHLMKLRMSIPTAWWPKVVAAAEERGYPVTLERLVQAHVADAPLREAASRRRKASRAHRTSEAA